VVTHFGYPTCTTPNIIAINDTYIRAIATVISATNTNVSNISITNFIATDIGTTGLSATDINTSDINTTVMYTFNFNTITNANTYAYDTNNIPYIAIFKAIHNNFPSAGNSNNATSDTNNSTKGDQYTDNITNPGLDNSTDVSNSAISSNNSNDTNTVAIVNTVEFNTSNINASDIKTIGISTSDITTNVNTTDANTLTNANITVINAADISTTVVNDTDIRANTTYRSTPMPSPLGSALDGPTNTYAQNGPCTTLSSASGLIYAKVSLLHLIRHYKLLALPPWGGGTAPLARVQPSRCVSDNPALAQTIGG